MPEDKSSKERKRMVVEEVETPVGDEKVSSTELEEKEDAKPEILENAAKTESAEASTKPVTEEIVPAPPQPIKKNSSFALWIIIPGIFLLGALLGGIVFYQRGVSKGQTETPTPEATLSPSATPTASPSAQINLTKYTIAVFNGSGTPGEAGKVKSLLTTAGFKVGTTANAATYDYTKTIIKAQSSVDSAYITQLSLTLGKTYQVDTPQTLSSSSSDMVQVIVGSSKATP